MRNPRPLLALLTGLLLATGGCLRRSDEASFYLLEPLPAASVAGPTGDAEQPSRPVIGVGPVKFPGYLNRPQIALAVGPGQIRFDEFRRWSEPLEENFTRVLAENLRRLLPDSEVVIYPWRRSLAVDVQLEVAVDLFHATGDGHSLLEAQWIMTRGGRTASLRRSSQQQPADPSNPAGIVAAQSETLAAFSREIATALKTLPP
jgi:uncharacterized lipoprotein YmbA